MLQQLCQEHEPEAFANTKLVLGVWVGRRILVYSVMVRLACVFVIFGTEERSVFKFGSFFCVREGCLYDRQRKCAVASSK